MTTDLVTYALKNKILLTNIISDGKKRATENVLLLVPLFKAGVLPDTNTIDFIQTLSPVQGEAQIAEWLDALNDMLGVSVHWKTFWKHWADVKYRSYCELWLNAIVHYWTTGLIDVAQPVGIQSVDNLNPQNNTLRVRLGTERDIRTFLVKKLETQSSLSEEDDYWVGRFLTQISVQNVNFASREVATHIAAMLIDTGGDLLLKTPLDVLRCAAWLSGFNPVELGTQKFKSLPRKIRVELLGALELAVAGGNYNIRGHENEFKRLNEKLHAGEFNAFPSCVEFFHEIYNSNNINPDNIDNVVLPMKRRLASATPGQLVRRSMSLGRQYGTKIYNKEFFDKLSKASNEQLLQLLTVTLSNQTRKVAVLPKAQSKYYTYVPVVQNEADTDYSKTLREKVTTILMEKFSELPSLGDVYVNPDLYNIALPFGERSNNGIVSLPRGSQWNMADGDILNFGINWHNIAGKRDYNTRVDLDLSVLAFDTTFDYLGEISWRNLRKLGRAEFLHSGDITDAPNGASEFIRVKNFKGYVVGVVTTFTGQAFETFDNEFVTFFGNKDFNATGYYNPATIKVRTNLAGKYGYALPMIADFVTNRLIVSNLYANKLSVVAGANVSVMGATLQSIVERKYITCGELLDMHIAVRGQKVADKENSDVVFENVNDVLGLLK